MKQAGASLLIATGLVVATTTLLALPVQEDSSSLAGLWRPYIGSSGYLEATECRYVFTLGRHGQVPNAKVVRVGAEYVVIAETRGGETMEYSIPLARAVLRRPTG